MTTVETTIRGARPTHISVAFTEEELGWLNWVMTQVLTSEDVTNSAKEKIIEAHKLFAEIQQTVHDKNRNMGTSE